MSRGLALALAGAVPVLLVAVLLSTNWLVQRNRQQLLGVAGALELGVGLLCVGQAMWTDALIFGFAGFYMVGEALRMRRRAGDRGDQ